MIYLSISPSCYERAVKICHDFPSKNDQTGELALTIVELLRSGPLPIEELVEHLLEQHATSEFSEALILYIINMLSRSYIIDSEILSGNKQYAKIKGEIPNFFPSEDPQSVLRLTRFTIFRADEGKFIIETPFKPIRISVFNEGFLICARLVQGMNFEDLCAPPFSIADREAIREIVMSLIFMELVHDTVHGEPDNLLQWEFHDLIFHTRARAGRGLGLHGGTYRFLGKRPPEDAVPKITLNNPLCFPERDLNKETAGLKALLEQRRSIRTYGDTPISATELRTFLGLVARNHSIEKANAEQGKHYDTIRRAYPAGGACHELVIYPVINRCDGLEQGIYCYDSSQDCLYEVDKANLVSEKLLRGAARSMGKPNPPDVLLCIAARFGRVNWKYEGVAYSVILKNVGVIVQTMYLVATAMRLAPCALGSGNSVDFLSATGNKHFSEETVGEFALGSLP